jgi:branched-chain amino acid transport system ATP-binding protein
MLGLENAEPFVMHGFSRVYPVVALLEVQEVSKSFGGVQALERVSLSLHQGDVVGLIGPNGAGKTTLFNVIYGLSPTAGRVFFKGEDITGRKPYDICKRGVARTFQLTRPFLELSVQDNVAAAILFGRNPKCLTGLGEARNAATQILERLQLQQRRETLAKDLLFAERRRLELARALATGPELLLLDEVMAGLAASEVGDMLAILNTLRQECGLTLLLIEHVMKVVMAICRRIVVLNYGSKLAEGTPQEVVSHQAVIDAYLGVERA